MGCALIDGSDSNWVILLEFQIKSDLLCGSIQFDVLRVIFCSDDIFWGVILNFFA